MTARAAVAAAAAGLLLAVPGAAPARGELLAEGPAFGGVALSGGEVLASRYEGDGGARRYEIRAHRGAQVTTVFRADAPVSTDADGGTSVTYGFSGSETHLAVLESYENISGPAQSTSYKLTFGRRGGARGIVAECENADGGLEPPAHAVSGRLLAVLDTRCTGLNPRLVTYGDGGRREVELPADTRPDRLALAGGYAAVGGEKRTIVLRLSDGAVMFSVSGAARRFALAGDATLAVVRSAGDCGPIETASPRAQQPAAQPGAEACSDIAIAGGRLVWPHGRRLLTAPVGGPATELARRFEPGAAFATDGEAAAFVLPACPGAAVHHLPAEGAGAPVTVPTLCPIRPPRTARLAGRDTLLRIRCPLGCVLSALRAAEVAAPSGGTAVLRVRLSSAQRSRLRSDGALALTVIVHVRRPSGGERLHRVRVTVRR